MEHIGDCIPSLGNFHDLFSLLKVAILVGCQSVVTLINQLSNLRHKNETFKIPKAKKELEEKKKEKKQDKGKENVGLIGDFFVCDYCICTFFLKTRTNKCNI